MEGATSLAPQLTRLRKAGNRGERQQEAEYSYHSRRQVLRELAAKMSKC